jgi:hypothetical protein
VPDAHLLVKPAFLSIPPRTGSYGDEAVDLALLAGRELDAEQQLAVDARLSYGPGGRWVALEGGIVEARQNGKTTNVLEPVTLFDFFLLPPDRIVWTAHLFRTAREAFTDFDVMIASTPYLSRRVKKISYANGEESIELHHPDGPSASQGAKLEFLARSKGGGRGLGGKRVVMDEALFLAAESMGALMPTLAARSMSGDPQIDYGSSAGRIDSDHLRGLRVRGRRGGDPTLVWVEFCDPSGWANPPCVRGKDCTHVVGTDGCALDDETRWRSANHALGRRISYEYVRGERRALSPREFGRERMGWWDDPVNDTTSFLEDWLDCTDTTSVSIGQPVYAIDVAPNSRSAAIVAATELPGGRTHLELVEYRTGVRWVAERCNQLNTAAIAPLEWVLDPGGPAGVLLPSLATVGIDPRKTTFRELGRACEGVSVAVQGHAIAHLGDPIITAAITGAGRRDIGDGMWAWSRRRSDADICPLVAASIAWWGLATTEAPKPPPASPITESAVPAAGTSETNIFELGF